MEAQKVILKIYGFELKYSPVIPLDMHEIELVQLPYPPYEMQEMTNGFTETHFTTVRLGFIFKGHYSNTEQGYLRVFEFDRKK